MREVQSASAPTTKGHRQILAVGEVGTGKTTAFRTLPGKKFAYLFDPNSLASLEGSDIDYIEFLVDRTDLDLAIKTLRKSGEGAIGDKQSGELKAVPKTYVNFEEDFQEREQSGFFKAYNWLMFDSLTTLGAIIMDRAQFLNKSMGKQPEQPDFAIEMTNMRNNLRIATSVCNLYCTAHFEPQRNELTGRVYNQLVITGKNRLRIPLMFSDIFRFDCELVGEKARYTVKTVKDREDPAIRTAVKGLAPVEVVTIDFKKPIEGQGIGAWF